MRSSKLFSNLYKMAISKKKIPKLTTITDNLVQMSKRLTMIQKYHFGNGKQSFPPDFSKNKVQGKLTGKQYEAIQFKTACLGLFSYLIYSQGQAVIIDPLNQTDQYLKTLKEKNLNLKYIFITHFHADFISGQTDLLKIYPNTKIIMGPNAKTDAYKLQILNDGESLKIGNVWLEAFHTPGHTMQSTCYILKTKQGHKQAIYTGDTVFVGEVGRPDLASKAKITPEQLAKNLYKSIQKIKKLPDDLPIYPTHGQGSACGKSIGKGDKTSVGCEKQKNYAFKAQTQSEFIDQVLKDLSSPPVYYFSSVETNKQHPFNFQQTFKKVFKPLTEEEFQKQMKNPNTYVLDVRTDNNQFYLGIIKESYFVGNGGPLASYVGTLFKSTDNFLIFGQYDQVEEATKRLLRIGYLNIKGYNDFDFDEWKGKIIKYEQGTIEDLKQTNLGKNNFTILDLRTKPQLQKQGIFLGKNIHQPIQSLRQKINQGKLPKDTKYLVHCASGYRSKIASTILEQNGFDFKVLADSWKQYKQKGANIIPKP